MAQPRPIQSKEAERSVLRRTGVGLAGASGLPVSRTQQTDTLTDTRPTEG